MSHFQYPHPWNPGYATPAYALAEPQGRGAFITKQLPRGTIMPFPEESRLVWNRTKWAAPDYTQGRYDKTAQTTKMIPRRTVGLLAPDFFARPSEKMKLPEPGAATVSTSTIGPKPTGPEWKSAFNGLGDCGSLGGSSLGDERAYSPADKDPIVNFGKKGAAFILREVMKRPRTERAAAMQIALESISPAFRADVDDKTKKYRAAGHKPKEALRRAIAASLSNKMLQDFIDTGRGRSGAVFSSLGGFSLSGIGKSIASGLASIHCAVATKGATQLAATVAGGVVGGPGGAAAANAGAQILAAPCGGGSSEGVPPMYVPPPPPSPLIPIAVAAGGALLLVLVLK